jgi:hypothetical protein
MILDYKAAEDRAGVHGHKLGRLALIMHAEFSDEDAMTELRILRASLAVEQAAASLEDIVRQEIAG